MKRLLRHIISLMLLLATLPVAAQINTDQVMRIGRNSLYFEDYILSIQYFNQVIKVKPFLAEPYFYRSVAKINLEDYSGAESDASLAIERNPFIVDAYQVRGVARQNLHNFNGAIEDYEAGLKLNPEEKLFIVNRAVCLAEVKRYDEADSAYRYLIKIDPKSDKPVLGLAHLYLARGDSVKALEFIEKGIGMSTKNASAYLIKADILMRSKKDYEGALEAMNEAIKLEPSYSGYFINRAYIKYNLDDYFGAMADYDYAISLDPASLEGHFNRALLLAEVGDNNKAIEDFNYVLKSHPDNFMAHYNRAMLYYRTGQYNKAVADYDAVLKKYPAFEAGYMARGETKRRMGDRKGGDADYDKALAIFKQKKTHVSDFNPIEIENDAAVKAAEKRRETGEDDPETQDEIMNKFNTLLTVSPENPNKPEYANKQRGRIQNSNMEIEPEPMFLLSYYAHDNKLNGNTYYIKEISELNDTRLLPGTLSLVSGDTQIDEESINRRFASIEYYNSTLSSPRPKAIDHFARGLDYMLVRNPEASIADATAAIAINKEFAMAYFLRANARYLKYCMGEVSEDDEKPADAQAQHMLRQRERTAVMQEVIADIDEMLKLMPKNAYAFFDKGNAFMTMNDYTSAISCYTKALEIKPDLAAAYYNRGLMYLRMGNKEQGVTDLSKAGELGILPSYNVLKRMNN